jgi:ketosteroid isomerase-like protein
MAKWAIEKAVAGDSGLATRMLADDVSFTFPGSTPFAASTHTKAEMVTWINRFAALQPEYLVRDVVVSGPPWNTRVAVRLSDRVGDDYANEGMQYLRMRWGKVLSEEVFLDTEKVAALVRSHPEVAEPAPV